MLYKKASSRNSSTGHILYLTVLLKFRQPPTFRPLPKDILKISIHLSIRNYERWGGQSTGFTQIINRIGAFRLILHSLDL